MPSSSTIVLSPADLVTTFPESRSSSISPIIASLNLTMATSGTTEDISCFKFSGTEGSDGCSLTQESKRDRANNTNILLERIPKSENHRIFQSVRTNDIGCIKLASKDMDSKSSRGK